MRAGTLNPSVQHITPGNGNLVKNKKSPAGCKFSSPAADISSSIGRGVRMFRTNKPFCSIRVLAILLIAVSHTSFALDPSLQPSQYVLDNWQIPEGLPQTSVQAIARTPDGYLWVGTQEGLARFDGVRFTVFDTGNEPAIPDKYISVLFVDRAGRLWIGTRSGVAVLENGRFKPFTTIAGAAARTATARMAAKAVGRGTLLISCSLR